MIFSVFQLSSAGSRMSGNVSSCPAHSLLVLALLLLIILFYLFTNRIFDEEVHKHHGETLIDAQSSGFYTSLCLFRLAQLNSLLAWLIPLPLLGEAELEVRLCTRDSIVTSAASQQQLPCADRPSLAATSCSVVVRVVGWWFKGSVAKAVVHHQPLHVTNCFPPFSDTPTEDPTLVIGNCSAICEANNRDNSHSHSP